MMHFSLIFVYVHSPVCICAFVTVISLYLPSGLVYTDVFLLFILSFVYLNVLAMTVVFFTLSVVIYIRAKVAHVINYLHLNTHVPECVHACICYLDGCMHD